MKSISAVILAGGKGRRFTPDKTFVKIEGKPIIKRQLDILRQIFEDIIIVTNTPKLYRNFKVTLVSDIIPNKGPLGGIYTGLLNSKTYYNFFFACDMPFINKELITFMVKRIKDADIIIPKHNDRFEPLYAIYSKKCVMPIKKLLRQNNLKISYLFSEIKPYIISDEELDKIDFIEKSFININTPQDYLKYKL